MLRDDILLGWKRRKNRRLGEFGLPCRRYGKVGGIIAVQQGPSARDGQFWKVRGVMGAAHIVRIISVSLQGEIGVSSIAVAEI